MSGRAKAVLILAELVVLVIGLFLVTRGSSAPPSNVGQVPAANAPSDAGSAGAARLGGARPVRAAVSETTSTRQSAAAAHPSVRTVGHPPNRLSLKAVGIDAQVVPVSVDAEGGLGVPTDVDHLGWWTSGAAPGASAGTVVIDGHVDSAVQGIGEFFYLEKATPGDDVVLSTAQGDVRYRVVARVAYNKADLPKEIFSQTGRPRLILITCGGSFDSKTHNYADNVVVYALPI